MTRYVIRRVLWVIVLLFGVISVTFVIFYLFPSGDPAVLLRVRNIVLPAMDLSNRTSDATFQVQIPYPNGVTGDAQTATVKYSISANPNVSPSPGP